MKGKKLKKRVKIMQLNIPVYKDYISNTMLTRYQHKRALYADVMENPLILSNILDHLETIDGVNLMLSSKKFVESPMLKKETNKFIKKKKTNTRNGITSYSTC